jgi:hypothetical protein
MAARWFITSSDRKRTEWLLAASALVVPADGTAEWFATYISRWRPLKYDQFVYQLDALAGEPSFVVGRLVAQSRGLTILTSVSYGLLPAATVLTFAAYLWLRSEEETIVLVRAFLLNLFLAVPIYLLFPVCGPAFAFPDFPGVQPTLLPHAVAIAAAPNGVPSVHMSSALLILWFLRHWRWGWFAGLTFVALTMMATLGSGQHYAFDLVCAVPYSIAIYRIAWSPRLFHARNVYEPPPPPDGAEIII